jgi:hypothetical protein
MEIYDRIFRSESFQAHLVYGDSPDEWRDDFPHEEYCPSTLLIETLTYKGEGISFLYATPENLKLPVYKRLTHRIDPV